ncbi:DnaJ domain-containing protein [Thiomicrospira microaerophila]|uniref:DnaJ domain-containing protein n=1 Tax=Thiomicrospira microaerophila TaxID=406020 RepID=UPI00200CA83B|nr:DnaJ domain-containing protein [Thiomicrospira microaerophila]UQB41632.1 DnaJ domain-containing protein [Thiomicrospira microaerophila]
MFTQHFDANKDYFAVLGLHNQACEKTIKLTYRRLARRYHPDVSKMPNATLKFQEISEAYEVLSKHREAYCRAFSRFTTGSSHSRYGSHQETQTTHNEGFQRQDYQAHSKWSRAPINGKDRVICYPLTLRYAIRLLQQGHFYIPGLKVKMKFTREAFDGKTFRLKGKGYQGLFGGQPGDYLVSFKINQESLSWKLQGADLYGEVKVPKSLLIPGGTVQFDSPVGALTLVVPVNYNQNEFIKIQNKGLPSDERGLAGHLYARLIAA